MAIGDPDLRLGLIYPGRGYFAQVGGVVIDDDRLIPRDGRRGDVRRPVRPGGGNRDGRSSAQRDYQGQHEGESKESVISHGMSPFK